MSDRARVPKRVAVYTHSMPSGADAAIATAARAAEAASCELVITQEEVDKRDAGVEGATVVVDNAEGVDLCLALGGDGTILRALRRYSSTAVPVFGVNYGTVGFLAAAEAEDLESGLARAFAGEFEVVSLPGLEIANGSAREIAVNDVSFTRRPHKRVAELSYSVSGREVGRVRCDGLVAATPAGSTGYNLANGGPVLAWGVSGFVVSFIAPHTLTARALVVAPDDVLEVVNRSEYDPVDVTTDGRTVCSLDPQEKVEVYFSERVAHLAQVSGATFYRRLRDKFGRLSY